MNVFDIVMNVISLIRIQQTEFWEIEFSTTAVVKRVEHSSKVVDWHLNADSVSEGHELCEGDGSIEVDIGESKCSSVILELLVDS